MEVIRLSGVPFGPSDDRYQIPERLARCLDQVPADVPAGLHLCYGDAGHKHMVEPESLQLPVSLVNSVVAAAGRPLSWVLFTVPQDRSDAEFFAPLRALRVGAAEPYFGIEHDH